jgi:hypothetical protein
LFRVLAHHPAEAWVSGGMVAVLIAVIFGVCLWNRAEDKRVPVVKAPDGPVCLHRDAVRVDSVLDRDKTVAWWCPACETQLGAGFIPPRRTCCGTPSGDRHLRNCLHAGAALPR